MEEVSTLSPARAVPTTVKIPEPMTAPMPSAVSDQGPRVFCRQCSGSSESLISLSIDLVANSCFRSVSAPLLYHPARPRAIHRKVPQGRLRVAQDVSPGLLSARLVQISFLRWFYPSIRDTLHGSANPHFVIPSEAEGPAV